MSQNPRTDLLQATADLLCAAQAAHDLLHLIRHNDEAARAHALIESVQTSLMAAASDYEQAAKAAPQDAAGELARKVIAA